MQFTGVKFVSMIFMDNQYRDLLSISSTFPSEHYKVAIHFRG